MSNREIAIIVGPAIALMAVAVVASVLGYGAWVGPRAVIAAVVWVMGIGLLAMRRR